MKKMECRGKFKESLKVLELLFALSIYHEKISVPEARKIVCSKLNLTKNSFLQIERELLQKGFLLRVNGGKFLSITAKGVLHLLYNIRNGDDYEERNE